MPKKKVNIYRFVYPDIIIIKKWFKSNFGFEINNSQAVTFALTSLKSLDLDMVNHISHLRGTYKLPFIDKMKVSVDTDLVDRVDVFLNTYDKVIIKSRTALISALITYRASSLPDILSPIKPIKFDLPKIAKKDCDMFTPRMAELIEKSLAIK